MIACPRYLGAGAVRPRALPEQLKPRPTQGRIICVDFDANHRYLGLGLNWPGDPSTNSVAPRPRSRVDQARRDHVRASSSRAHSRKVVPPAKRRWVSEGAACGGNRAVRDPAQPMMLLSISALDLFSSTVMNNDVKEEREMYVVL